MNEMRAQSLLSPLVLYFHNEEDRKVLLDAILAEKPNMISQAWLR